MAKKKRFKEYFLEFLMIFLAVTMGFIAENIREHLSDNAKEHEYITGMVKNLGDDTTNLKNIIRTNLQQIYGVDSLKRVTKDKLQQLPVQDSLYLLTSRYLFYANNFKNNDITLTQLRNAGGYRLIKSDAVLDSIAVYESKLRDLNDQFGYVYSSLAKAREYANSIFDLNIGHTFRLKPTTTTVLITTDKEKIYNYYNQCWMVLIGLDGYNHMLKEHLKYSAGLIITLKKEYDLD